MRKIERPHRGRLFCAMVLVGVSAATLAGAAPALAAPTLAVSLPCIISGISDPADLTGSGFSPNGQVQLVLALDGAHVHKSAPLFTLTADATGALPAGLTLTGVNLNLKPDLEATATITANDLTQLNAGAPAGPNTSASAKFIATSNGFDVAAWNAQRFDPRATTTFTARGFAPLKVLYVLHGKVVKRVRLGALTGPCGNLQRGGDHVKLPTSDHGNSPL